MIARLFNIITVLVLGAMVGVFGLGKIAIAGVAMVALSADLRALAGKARRPEPVNAAFSP